MNNTPQSLAVRVALAIGSLVLATAISWRGNTFIDPAYPSSLVAPVMCVLTGLTVLITGVTLACGRNSSEFDAQP